jgi:hypothetical protein
MKKLNDYSGELLPDLKFSDFSPDTLADLLTSYSKLYLALDGFWYLTVKEKLGNEVALACDLEVLKKVAKYEMAKVTELLNIRGSDVATVMKAMQTTPWFRNTEHKIEIENQNTAVLTITHCATLNALEKEGDGRENEICKIVEPIVFKQYASFFNPHIEVRCLKSPPRKSKDEICCQWEFTLDK